MNWSHTRSALVGAVPVCLLLGTGLAAPAAAAPAAAPPTIQLSASGFCNGDGSTRNVLRPGFGGYAGYALDGTLSGLTPGHTYLWHDLNGNVAAGYATLGTADDQGVVTVVDAKPADDADSPTFPQQRGQIVDQATTSGTPVVATTTVRIVSTCGVLRADTRYSTLVNGATRLVQQGDGNLVVYRGAQAVWQAKTSGHPGAVTTLQTDGNLVVRAADNTTLWTSRTAGHPQAYVVVQGDGNVVLYSGVNPNVALFQTRTYR